MGKTKSARKAQLQRCEVCGDRVRPALLAWIARNGAYMNVCEQCRIEYNTYMRRFGRLDRS